MNKTTLNCALFSFGYSAYSLIELAFRKYTHYSMGMAGGLCFLALYYIYRKHKNLSLFKKCAIGSLFITLIEFCFGCVFNLLLKLDIWDYSALPFNILGQICPLFSFLWLILCIPIVFLSGKIENKIKMQKRT